MTVDITEAHTKRVTQEYLESGRYGERNVSSGLQVQLQKDACENTWHHITSRRFCATTSPIQGRCPGFYRAACNADAV